MSQTARAADTAGGDVSVGGLAKGSLKTRDAIVISISVLSPGMAMALNTGGVAGTAGGSTPLAFLLGGVACLALAFVVIGFTRRMSAAGYAYTYVSRSLGQRAGFLAGWLYFFGFACFVPMTMAAVGFLLADLLGINPVHWWFPFFLIGMGLLVVLSVIKISFTTKVQLLIGVFTVLVLLVMGLIITGKGGAHGQSLAPFTFGHTVTGGFHGVFYGLIFGITSFIGFESAADFGEETANPRRAVPIAIIAAVVFAIIFYVFITYAVTIGYGVNELQHPGPSGVNVWALGGLTPAATQYGDKALAKLVEIGALLSAFVVCVACATGGARTLFAMGREGVAPAWFAKTHPKYKTPVNATVTIAVVAAIGAAIIGFGFGNSGLFGSDAFTVYYFFATIGTLAVVLVYFALCLGGISFFKKTSPKFNPLIHGLIPLVGAVIFAAAWYGSITPVPHNVLRAAPYITAIWLVIGIGVLMALNSSRPEAVARIGTILGEEGGELVEALDHP
jgi:amino acid transporter